MRSSVNRKTGLRTSTLAVKHGTVLEQRDIDREVYVVWVRNDIFLVRDFCQTLRSNWLSGLAGKIANSGKATAKPSKQRITFTAVIHSALCASESARHSRRTCGFLQRLPRKFVASSATAEEAVTRDSHPRKKGRRVRIAPLPESRIDTVVREWSAVDE